MVNLAEAFAMKMSQIKEFDPFKEKDTAFVVDKVMAILAEEFEMREE